MQADGPLEEEENKKLTTNTTNTTNTLTINSKNKLSLLEKQRIWEKYYYSPQTGYVSSWKLWHKLPAEAKGSHDLENFEQWYNTRKSVAVNRIPPPKRREWSSVTAAGVLDRIQIDRMIYDRYKPLVGPNKDYTSMMVMIDVYSRYMAITPMKTKDLKATVQVIDSEIKQWGKGYPRMINCDNEFNFPEFNNWALKHNIKVAFSQPYEINKNAIVERVNRTIAGMIQKWRIATNQTDWVAVLPQMVTNYNSTFHKTIKAKPIDVFEGKEKNHQQYKILPQAFKLGEMVRRIEERNIFTKGDQQYYSSEVYRISNVKGFKYELTDISSGKSLPRFYKSYELARYYEIGTEKGFSHADLEDPAVIAGKTDPQSVNPITPTIQKNVTLKVRRVTKEANNIGTYSHDGGSSNTTLNEQTLKPEIKHKAQLLPLRPRSERHKGAALKGRRFIEEQEEQIEKEKRQKNKRKPAAIQPTTKSISSRRLNKKNKK